MPNFDQNHPMKLTRCNNNNVANCEYICLKAGYKNHKKNPPLSESPTLEKICHCSQIIALEKKTSMQEKFTDRVKHLRKFYHQTTWKNQGSIVNTILKNNLIIESSTIVKDVKVRFSNLRGKPTNVFINPTQKDPLSFQEKVLDNYMVDNNLTVQNMSFRKGAGWNSVPKDYAQHVSIKANLLENVYKTDKMEFEIKCQWVS